MTLHVRKAFAYVTRPRDAGHELLVFRSLDEPEGFEVPKGAARPDETFEEAARRELLEESGVDAARPLGEIGTTWFGDEEQHLFHFAAPDGLPARFRHIVTGDDGDAGESYGFEFLPIDDALASRLVQGSDQGVAALRRRLNV